MSELREVGAAVDRLTREVDLLRALVRSSVTAPGLTHPVGDPHHAEHLPGKAALAGDPLGDLGPYESELRAALERALEAGQ